LIDKAAQTHGDAPADGSSLTGRSASLDVGLHIDFAQQLAKLQREEQLEKIEITNRRMRMV